MAQVHLSNLALTWPQQPDLAWTLTLPDMEWYWELVLTYHENLPQNKPYKEIGIHQIFGLGKLSYNTTYQNMLLLSKFFGKSMLFGDYN